MDFLAGHDFEKEAVYLKADGGHVYEPDEWTSGDATGAVFVDGTGKLNLLAGVSLVSLELVRFGLPYFTKRKLADGYFSCDKTRA